MSKKKSIMEFGESFLRTLSEQCIQTCGRSLSAVQFPVFKKFLSLRIKREIQFYYICLDMAETLVETGTGLDKHEVEDIIEESKLLDKKFKRDIMLLPLRVDFDYDVIIPLRKERTVFQVGLFTKLLKSGGEVYEEMAHAAFSKDEFVDIHNEILELYAEEAFVINLALRSVIEIDTEGTAYRVHCSMLDIGVKLNREIADRIFAGNSLDK